MLISFLFAVLILAIILYVVNLVIGMLSLPPQVKTIALLIIGLIFLFYLLNLLGVNIGGACCSFR